MAVEKTLAIIKPDAVRKGVIGEIIQRMEEANLRPAAIKMIHLSNQKAEGFYAVHKDKGFFSDLVGFMTSGPVVVVCLVGENGVAKWRDAMGSTDPVSAKEGSIRRDYGSDIQNNAVHGSDGNDTAKFEVSYFFEPEEVFNYEWD